MIEILNCLPRPPSKGKCHKVSFTRIQRLARVGFESRPCRSQSRPFNHSLRCGPKRHLIETILDAGGGNSGIIRAISRDEGADQLHEVPIIGQPLRDETRGLEW